jgi:hypothetical protein
MTVTEVNTPTFSIEVRILPNDKGTPNGKLADAEIEFKTGVFAGLRLVGFAVERRNGPGRNVTFPARTYSVNGERRSFALLRPGYASTDAHVQDGVRDMILEAYKDFEHAAAEVETITAAQAALRSPRPSRPSSQHRAGLDSARPVCIPTSNRRSTATVGCIPQPSQGESMRQRDREFVVVDEQGDEHELPTRFEVCGRCDGKGTHVNPSVDEHGISPEEFRDDPDFEEAYFGGVYDVTCYDCRGERVGAWWTRADARRNFSSSGTTGWTTRPSAAPKRRGNAGWGGEMKITFDIATDNEAFANGNKAAEVARIVREAAKKSARVSP